MTESSSALLERAATLAWSDETGDWITDQWWFWVLIFLWSVVLCVGGQALVYYLTKRR